MVDDDYNLFSKNGLMFLIAVRFINLKGWSENLYPRRTRIFFDRDW